MVAEKQFVQKFCRRMRGHFHSFAGGGGGGRDEAGVGVRAYTSAPPRWRGLCKARGGDGGVIIAQPRAGGHATRYRALRTPQPTSQARPFVAKKDATTGFSTMEPLTSGTSGKLL